MYNYNYSDSYLEHHGVKGQKWGVRRYQNYDGTLIGAKRRNKVRTDLGSRLRRIRAERAKKAAAKAKAKELKKQESFEEAKAKAIATGDIKKILEMRGSLTTAELRDAAQRQIAIKQIRDNQLPKDKSALEKIVAKLDKAKTTMDSVKNFHKSATELRDELFGKKKDKNQQDQNGKKKDKGKGETTSESNFDKLADMIAKKLSNANTSSEPNEKGTEDAEGSEKESPIISKVKETFSPQKNDDYLSKLKSVGKIFTDTTPKTQAEITREKNESWISKLSSVSRDMSVERVKNRNASGWTATNNDEWLSVLRDASNIHLHDPEWNKYNPYK